LLAQGKDDNEAGRKKDEQETANLSAREYKSMIVCLQPTDTPDRQQNRGVQL
jgi:hypothetical protein